MADDQSRTSTMVADLTLEGNERINNEQSPGTVAYWCYQCNKEVIAESDVRAGGVDGVRRDMVCPDCCSGFIEMMATARTLPDVRLAQRRHLRSSERTSDHRSSSQVEASEEVEVLRLLRVLARTTRSSQRSTSRSTEDQIISRSQGSGRETSETQGPGFVELSANFRSATGSGNGQEEENVGRAAALEGESPSSEALNSVLGDEESTVEAENVSIFLTDDVSLSHEDEVEEVEESDSDAEARLLGLGDWDSLDEEDDEEWEEVDGDDLDVTRMTMEDSDERMREEYPAAAVAEVDDWENNFPGDSEEQPSRTEQTPRSRNVYRNLHHRLLEILRNMDGRNLEVRLDTPEIDTYVGNPGDYVDARGFEQLLQQLLENDNSHRGAPPAAKTTLEALPLVTIKQENLDDGSALCAICKDVVALGKSAKQLPCLHLYHDSCIVPWLCSRNSCPVCRYELPTDDPEYEEQKCQNVL